MNSQKIIIWSDRAMAFSFYALIYFLPISIALTESFAGLVLFFYIFKRGAMLYDQIRKGYLPWRALSFFRKVFSFFRSFKPVENALNWPIGIFLFFTFMSVIFSEIPLLSLRGYVGKTLEFAFLYFSFLECMHSRKRIKIFLTIYLISFALICVNGMFQYFTGQEFIHGNLVESGRISSSLRHANDFGSYLILFIPVLFFLSVLCGRRSGTQKSDFSVFASLPARVILFLLFILALVCLGLTFSRGAWMALILSLFLAGCIKLRLLLPCFLLIVIFLFAATLNLKGRNDGIFEEIRRFMSLTNKADKRVSLERILQYDNNRMVYWQGTGEIIKDYPLFGTGLNTYSQIVGRYKKNFGVYAHNCYLQMTAEIGLLGITAFFGVLFALFRNSLEGLRLIKDQAHWLLLFGFLVGLLAFLIHSFYDTNFYSVQLSSLMWITIGVIVTLQKENR